MKKMNRKLITILAATIIISALLAILAGSKSRFYALSSSLTYIDTYGSTLFIYLILLAVAAGFATAVLYHYKRTFAVMVSFSVTVLAIFAMCLPNQAQSIQVYFSHESRQSRFIEKFNKELQLDDRFRDVQLSYWHGKGEGCEIKGTVASFEDLIGLQTIVKTKTGLGIDCDVDIKGRITQ